MRRILAIVNPISGRRSMLPLVEATRDIVVKRGGAMTIEVTAGPGDATTIARRASDSVDAILVVGGDGTVCEVVNGIVGRSVPLLVMRTGTENLVSREFQMPRTPEAVADTMLSGKTFYCDVGVVNGRYFLAVVGIGFDAEVVHQLAQARRGHITHFSYLLPAWRVFLGHRFPRLRIEVDGRLVFDDVGLAIIGQLSRYCLGMRIAARARHDDGLIDVCAFRCDSRRQLLAHALRALFRRHLRNPSVVYAQGRRIQVGSPDHAFVEIDGEAAGCLPIDCSVVPRAVMFLRAPTDGDHTQPRE